MADTERALPGRARRSKESEEAEWALGTSPYEAGEASFSSLETKRINKSVFISAHYVSLQVVSNSTSNVTSDLINSADIPNVKSFRLQVLILNFTILVRHSLVLKIHHRIGVKEFGSKY